MTKVGFTAALFVVGALAASPAVAEATVFSDTGAEQVWTVPDGATAAQITAVGAPGGGAGGGQGAIVSATVAIPAGTPALYVEVGGPGTQATGTFDPLTAGGGFNGGGDGGQSQYGLNDAFGGGGASDVRTCSAALDAPCSVTGGTLASRLIVAAGGGGGGSGGGGGGSAGQPGTGASSPEGPLPIDAQPGTQSAGGTGAHCYLDAATLDFTGGPGTLGAGGSGDGGANMGAETDGNSGGGGGGGYFGGGGSIAYDELTGCDAGGGAGGSSYVAGDTAPPAFTLDPTRTPQVTITAPVPAAAGGPRIVGRAVAGSTLVDLHASWSNAPTTYAYQWSRCTGRVSALSCTGIPEATGRTYKVKAADAGHWLEVTETASNAYGTGTSATSKPDRVRLIHLSSR